MAALTATLPAALTPAPAVDVRCASCAGYLIYSPAGALSHVDTCPERHPADQPCPDDRTTHSTCDRPRPVLCGHPHRRATPATLNALPCRGDLGGCCGCCHETEPS